MLQYYEVDVTCLLFVGEIMSIESKRIQAHREKNYDFVKRYKESNPCKDCGVRYPHYVVDLDHVRGDKKYNVSKMTTYSKARILEEIAKCDVVCSNCHRARTHARLA